jgi:hypothetical protein
VELAVRFRFRVSKARHTTHAQRQAVSLKMENDQPFLRLCVDPIQLTKDTATHDPGQLLPVVGRPNLQKLLSAA